MPHPVANLASRVAVISHSRLRYLAFSRIPHRILAKFRIPKIPFAGEAFSIPFKCQNQSSDFHFCGSDDKADESRWTDFCSDSK